MSQPGRYVYGIIEGPDHRPHSRNGIGNGDVGLIHYRDLAAVVSHVPVKEIDRFDEELLTSELRNHQLVLEDVMRHCTVIPMKFGIVARSEDDVKGLLAAAYADIKQTFGELDDSVELNLQAAWDEAKVLSEVTSGNESVARFRQVLASAGSGQDTGMRIELGRAVFTALDRVRRAHIKDVVDTLNEVATRSCSGKLTTADMILNESFLVKRDREAEFDRKVNLLAETYDGTLGFKYVGPMPPYSFVDLEATVLNADTVERARDVLGVGEQVTMAEIRSAYRKLARRYHPDRNTGSPGEVEQFRQVSEAFETLTKYVRSLGPVDRGRYTFKPEQIDGSIMVARRR